MSPRPSDIFIALSLLSRLPVPQQADASRPEAAWAYPLVGIVIGVLSALVMALALLLGLPLALAALLAVLAQVVMTGAMHEDGLADMADGFWGGWDRAARLKIMRDSAVGSYGVIALVLGLLGRVAAIWLLLELSTADAACALVVAATLSRASMPVLMCVTPKARDDGLAHSVGSVAATPAAIAVGIAVLTALILLGWSGIAVFFWAALATLGVALLARSKIGGHTGDVLGASQQITEIAILFSILA